MDWRSSGPILRGLCEGHTDQTHTCLGGPTKALWKYTQTRLHTQGLSQLPTDTKTHSETFTDSSTCIFTLKYIHTRAHIQTCSHTLLYTTYTQKKGKHKDTHTCTLKYPHRCQKEHTRTQSLSLLHSQGHSHTQRPTKTGSKTLAYLSTQAGTREYILTKAHTYFVHTPVYSGTFTDIL